MPLVQIKLDEEHVDASRDAEVVPNIVRGVTEALVEATGVAREYIWVIVEGIPKSQWGVGGNTRA